MNIFLIKMVEKKNKYSYLIILEFYKINNEIKMKFDFVLEQISFVLISIVNQEITVI